MTRSVLFAFCIVALSSGATQTDMGTQADSVRLEKGKQLENVVVYGSASNFGSASSQMSAITLSKGQILTVPVFLGEPDVMKSLQKFRCAVEHRGHCWTFCAWWRLRPELYHPRRIGDIQCRAPQGVCKCHQPRHGGQHQLLPWRISCKIWLATVERDRCGHKGGRLQQVPRSAELGNAHKSHTGRGSDLERAHLIQRGCPNFIFQPYREAHS